MAQHGMSDELKAKIKARIRAALEGAARATPVSNPRGLNDWVREAFVSGNGARDTTQAAHYVIDGDKVERMRPLGETGRESVRPIRRPGKDGTVTIVVDPAFVDKLNAYDPGPYQNCRCTTTPLDGGHPDDVICEYEILDPEEGSGLDPIHTRRLTENE